MNREECEKVADYILKENEENKKYPIVNRDRHRRNRRREQTAGLIGLQPARLPTDISVDAGYDSCLDSAS